MLEQPRVLLSLKKNVDLPWFGECLRIVDGSLIGNSVRVAKIVAFHNGHRFAVEIAGGVKPRLAIIRFNCNDERISFPMSSGVTHPEFESVAQRRFAVG